MTVQVDLTQQLEPIIARKYIDSRIPGFFPVGSTYSFLLLSALPIGEDPAAHGHWCAFDLKGLSDHTLTRSKRLPNNQKGCFFFGATDVFT